MPQTTDSQQQKKEAADAMFIKRTHLLAAAATGRLAANEPNVMAINKDDIVAGVGGNLRALFIPAVPGWRLLSVDYSQASLNEQKGNCLVH